MKGNMRCYLQMSFVFRLVILGGHVRMIFSSTEAPTPTLKKCVQKEDHNISCEDFISEKETMVSHWPAGPYVIPMTRHGCPESAVYGWREGYLSITWQTTHPLHVLTKNIAGNETLMNITKEQLLFDWSSVHVLIPASPNALKLSFCYKYRNNISIDIGSWPGGNFKTYATEDGCPSGFIKDVSNITLPNISRWEYDGYLPKFKIINDGTNNVLQMHLCYRRTVYNTSVENTDENAAGAVEFPRTPDTDMSPYWTDFFLIKDDENSCPTFQSSIVIEETLFLAQPKNHDAQMIPGSDTLCYYEINTVSKDSVTWMLEKRLKNAYSVYIASITLHESVFTVKDFISTLQWKIVDLGRTIAVSAVDLTDETETAGICRFMRYECFVSQEKWNFLKTEALLCPYVPICRIWQRSVSLLFSRIMEGRFVTLTELNAPELHLATIATISVFTERITNDDSSSCNTDLGIKDMCVEEDEYYEYYQNDEEEPFFLQIDFPTTTVIEGITVYNSRAAEDMVTFGQTALLIIVAGDLSNFSTYNKTFIIDTTDFHQETFWFWRKLHAKSVHIVMQKGERFDLICIRFELLGCRTAETLQTTNAFVRKEQLFYHEVVAFTSEIHGLNSILTNVGYPHSYQSNQVYKWIIRYPEFHFIKLVFTHLTLNVRRPWLLKEPPAKGKSYITNPTCNDSLIITKDLENGMFARALDTSFSSNYIHSLTVATKETQIVLSFVSCSITSKTVRGSGFKAFATYENIPACFSIQSHVPWSEGLKETCRQSAMLITSLSYLGFPFYHTNEQWTIHVPTKRVHVQILEFNVPCQSKQHESVFKIINMGHETYYCNIEKPPYSLNSSYDSITIHFSKDHDYLRGLIAANVAGFRIIYSTIHESEDREKDYQYNISKVRNVALEKPTYSSSRFQQSGGIDTDGLTLQQSKCLNLHTGERNWWLVDLQNIYTLRFVVVHSKLGSSLKSASTCQMMILTGLTFLNMQQTGHFCGVIETSRTISLHGISARYVELQLECEDRLFIPSLCEVQVYGELDLLLAETFMKDTSAPRRVHGEWGEWSTWTDVCYCEGRQFRKRLCDSPSPQFDGYDCPPGESISHRSCEPITNNCKIYGEPKKKLCEDNFSDSSDLRTWSVWRKCSSECGYGLTSRRKLCKNSELTETARQCSEDVIEVRPCLGKHNCLVCKKMFQKCYSIISRKTNWNQARLECFRRNMTLVSMLSLSEMRFIKKLLRERRNLDWLPSTYFDAEFYVHIGLRLGKKKYYEVLTWENGFYATYFTAWNNNNLSSGNCTRMNFKLYDDDNTWEHEDCNHKLAEYIMCEYKQQNTRILKSLSMLEDAEMEEVPEQILASEYNGNLSITVSGRSCKDSPCRFDKNVGYIGCKNVNDLWEECSVKLPTKTNTSAVYYTYLGSLSSSFSGKVCQRWDTVYPHQHEIHGHLFKGEGISDASNHCRDPGDTGALWCFTADNETRWEPCILKETKADRRCLTNLKYTGQRNKSITGKSCQQWNKQSLKNADLTDADIANGHNYCRDPYNVGYNWCYIDTSRKRWEPCQVEEAQSVKEVDDTYLENTFSNILTCDNGRVIPQYFKCDGKIDCYDGFDEVDCSYSVHSMMRSKRVTNVSSDINNTSSLVFEQGLFFRCNSHELISIVAKCDGVIDCFDASDEIDCHEDSIGKHICTKEQFKCADGDCIHVSLVCNFRDDCVDGSDEYFEFKECAPLTEFRCNNGPCIPSEQRCNSVKQCLDGSDELTCDDCQPNVAFHCDIVRCIPIRLKCDQFVHWEDGTDEQSCGEEILTSCQDAWEAGYRKSGHYIIGDVQVECKFEDVLKGDTIGTVFNFDIKYEHTSSWVFATSARLINLPVTMETSPVNDIIYYRDNTSCVQQMKEVCVPSYENIARLQDSTRQCFCGIINYEIKKESTRETHIGIEKCNSTVDKIFSLSFDKPVPKSALSRYNQHNGIPSVPNNDDYQIVAGSAICKQDYRASDNDFICGVKGKHIPVYLRCIYDIDETGFPVGCRDGSHLIDCGNFDCPPNTVKCLDSYCIPQRFVCDGVLQCPGGDDEEHCGCSPIDNEILIIHDEESTDGPDIGQFARQFSTQTNIVRILSYKTSRPLIIYIPRNIILEIRDVEINPASDIETLFECRYKITARTLLESVFFTNDGIKGVILIQSSGIAKDVIDEILEHISVLGSDFRFYRVTEDFNTVFTPAFQNPMPKISEVRVKRWRILNDIGANYFSELCNVTTKVHCPYGYKCASSKTCLPIEQVCDGVIQCVHGDDEVLCDFQCPYECNCVGFISNCSASDFNLTMIRTIPKNTRFLDFSFNGELSHILEDSLLNILTLSVLNMSSCEIERLTPHAFVGIRNLRSLDLSFNSLTFLMNYVFDSLKHLVILSLRGNHQLSTIEVHAFYGLSRLQYLNLESAKLVQISADTFSELTLRNLDMSNNKIEELDDFAFRDASVENLNFGRNDIKTFNTEIFTGMILLKKIITPAFKFCCIRPNYVQEENCYPHKDEFSSCDDLMRHSVLQFLIWLIGITALLGNFSSIFYRLRYDRKRLKRGFGIFVTNLAVADSLMAMYLLIIAVADSAFKKRYIFVDEYWRHSVWCNLAGILSTISSEASVLFLCLITLDRILVIKFPFGGAKLSAKKSSYCVMATWLFSASVAILPVAYEGYFNNEFYSKSGVCIALPLTRDRPPGWAYSLTIFVCLNFVTFILVAVGQLSIFVEIRKSTGIATSVETARKRDLKIARNLLLVVATDFMCWFPIGVLGMLALTGHVISGEVYAWAAIFILPINSALNPILYTLSAIIGRNAFNPSAGEQSLMKATKEMGEKAIGCATASRRLTGKRTHAGYRQISELVEEEVHITPDAVLMIAAKLAHTLDAFHNYSLGIKSLNVTTVIVCICNRKLTGAMKIKGEPFISYKPEDKVNDMNQFGLIVRRLIAKIEKNTI